MSSAPEENPFGFGNGDPFGFGGGGNNNADDAAHVVPNPFGFGGGNDDGNAAADPFAFGGGNDAAHVVENPFAFGGAAAAPANNDPFAFGNQDAAAAPAHVVANPFGFGNQDDDAAAAPGHVVENPFAFGFGGPAQDNNDDAALNVVANPFDLGFGAPGAVAAAAANPFGFGNDGAQDDQEPASLGESFLTGHMARLSECTSMKLSRDEQRWAKELKAAVEASNDIPHITDMEVAQHSIVHDGNVLNALLSIRALEDFKRIYEIQDTPEEGLQAIQALLKQQQGAFLDLETNPQTQETSVVIDLKAFHPNKALRSVPGKPADHSFHVLARGVYYLFKATTSSLAAARNGLFLVVDCDGVGWDNCNNELDQRLHAELLQHLPVQWKKVMAYSSALVASVWWGLIKRMVSKQFSSKLEKGCRLVDTDPSKPPRRIADMHRIPDLKTAQAKLERSAQDLLLLRENNEQEFQIKMAPATTVSRR